MEDFEFSHLCGWDNEVATEALKECPPEVKRSFQLIGDGPKSKRIAFFEIARKVIGKDPENIPQEIGDCVSWGYKHGVEDLQCYQIAMGNLSQFRLIFPSYHYGTGKVYIGGQGRWAGDGSVGSWQSRALTEYGVVCTDDSDVPPYSGAIAKQYGYNGGGVLDKLSPLGKQHLVKGTSLVTTWDQLVDSLTNGYPVPVCSNQGFNMLASSDGFHAPRGSWGHCMEICYVDDDGDIEPHCGIRNSWGDVHGQIIDFRDPTLKWPVGMLRVRKNVVESMLAMQDSFALSSFEDFPAQILPVDFFRQW